MVAVQVVCMTANITLYRLQTGSGHCHLCLAPPRGATQRAWADCRRFALLLVCVLARVVGLSAYEHI